VENIDWIGRLYTSEFGWSVLEDLTEVGPRLGGSPGEARAHRRVAEAFDEAGLRDVGEHTFDQVGWTRGSSSLSTTTPREVELDCIALPGSPAATVDAEFVHLGHGLPDDFAAHDVAGKIVVVRSDVPPWFEPWMHRREKYGLAIEAGAAAFVFANHVEGCLPPTGSLGGGMDVIGELPAVGASKEVGERLRRFCERGEVHGRLKVDAEIGDTTSRNTHGVLGPDSGPEIIVCAHVDGHDISQAATDNGAGVAIMCDVARALAQHPDKLQTRVRFIGFGSEELGLLGSKHWAADHDLDDIRVVVNLDGIGDGRDQVVYANRIDEFREVVDRVSTEFRHPIQWRRKFVLHSDHWPFVLEGVPGLMVAADSGEKGRGFGHTFADTLDKVDVRALRDHAILVTRMVELLSDPELKLPRRDAATIEKALREMGAEERLERAGDWPY
jgi:Zn-dependent M28 family amino/carboxypeptidase